MKIVERPVVRSINKALTTTTTRGLGANPANSIKLAKDLGNFSIKLLE